jgi:hypothetical protein
VINRAPSASATYSPTSPVAGDPVTFTSTSIDFDGQIAISWDLDGDGRFDNGRGPICAVHLRHAWQIHLPRESYRR